VLRDLWRELHAVARRLDMSSEAGDDVPYDPDSYRAIYEAVLRGRPVEIVRFDRVLPTQAMSVYDVDVPRTDLVPTEMQADAAVREAEARYPDVARLSRDVEDWWQDPWGDCH
jgi:hypothetical protein